MTRRSRSAILASALLVLSLTPAQAQDTPSEYAFDVTKIELCTDSTCTTAVVLGEGSQRFDLAAVSVGAAAGNFISDFSLAPNQTYTHLRVTHSRAIDMTATAAGVTATPGLNNCITDGTVNGGIGELASSTTEAAALVATTGAAATSQTFVVPDTDANNAPGGLAATYAAEGIVLIDATNLAITKELTTPFISGTSAPAIDAAFDVANTITFQDTGANDLCLVFLGAPSVTITIQ